MSTSPPRRGKKSPPSKSPETGPDATARPPEWADANYRAVLEAAPDAMLVVNRAGEIVTANLQAQKFYGCSREDLIGSVVESLIPARLRDRHRRHRENFFANPKTQTIQVLEIFAVRRDVSEVPVDVSLSQLTIGAETFAISAIRDATERRRIEGLKVSAERRGRLVQNSSVAMVVTHGLEHKVELLNDKFTALLGYTIDDIPDVAHWWPLAYSDEAYRQAVRSEWETRTEKTLRDGTPFAPMEVTVRCKDGCTRHLEVHLSTMAGDTNLVTFIDLTERKAAEEALRESEEQFRTLAEAIPQLCWMAHGDGHIFWYNQRWYTYTGTTPEQMEGWGWQSVHDPQVLPLVLERWKTSIATGDSFDMVFPLRAADGVFHPFLTRVTPVKDSEGRVARWFGTNTDVTELRNAQEALLEMSRKLVQAQEQERARIARELHDDINQRLAMLGIELQQLREHYPELPEEVSSRMEELQEQTTEISTNVQALSHDLHSSQLEYLGVVAGMKSWCKEFGERQGMQVDCRHDVRSTLPQEIGLCLFRVLQEALHNTAKHSGVKRIEVQLHEESDEIHLTIRDLGKGFDVEAAKKGRGLGLTSMQERVRLVNGAIEIQSKPMGGTTIHVRIPLSSENASQRAAG